MPVNSKPMSTFPDGGASWTCEGSKMAALGEIGEHYNTLCGSERPYPYLPKPSSVRKYEYIMKGQHYKPIGRGLGKNVQSRILGATLVGRTDSSRPGNQERSLANSRAHSIITVVHDKVLSI